MHRRHPLAAAVEGDLPGPRPASCTSDRVHAGGAAASSSATSVGSPTGSPRRSSAARTASLHSTAARSSEPLALDRTGSGPGALDAHRALGQGAGLVGREHRDRAQRLDRCEARTTACRRAIRRAPRARLTETTTGNDSGTAATARVTAVRSMSSRASPRSSPSTSTTARPPPPRGSAAAGHPPLQRGRPRPAEQRGDPPEPCWPVAVTTARARPCTTVCRPPAGPAEPRRPPCPPAPIPRSAPTRPQQRGRGQHPRVGRDDVTLGEDHQVPRHPRPRTPADGRRGRPGPPERSSPTTR